MMEAKKKRGGHNVPVEVISSVVPMAQVPDPPVEGRGRWWRVWEDVCALKTGSALKV